jgi:predicted nucleic acid-binding protein
VTTGVLIDSDILIEVLRGRNSDVTRTWLDAVSSSEPLFYSPVSSAEIRHGMRESERDVVERLFSGTVCVPIDEEIGKRAGDYLRAFHASHAVELADALIAASASVHQLQVWTRNRKHFPMKDLEFFTMQQR